MTRDDNDITPLIEAHRSRLSAYLRAATRCNADAEELVQEVMLRAWRGRGELHDPQAISSWLYRIATNVLIERARADARRPAVTTDLTALHQTPSPSTHEDVTRAPELHEMSGCVTQLTDRLPDAQRAALVLHDAYGLTNPEVADTLGCSVAAAKIRLHRARARMNELVGANCTVASDDRGIVVCEPSQSEPAPRGRPGV